MYFNSGINYLIMAAKMEIPQCTKRNQKFKHA